MDTRQLVRALKTPVTLLLLAALVYFAARWGLDAVRTPIPPRPPTPCAVRDVGPNLTPEHVYVNVYNGSEVNGLAKRLGSVLSADGFKVVRRVNAPSTDHQKSLVVGHSEQAPEVVLVRQAFQGIDFRADDRVDHTVDVIIGHEQPVPAESPKLTVPLPDGKACLPQISAGEIEG